MSEERRDSSRDIADIRVNVATIMERTAAQGKILDEVKDSLSKSVSRGEYEAKHTEVVTVANEALGIARSVRDDGLRRQGREQVWRVVYTSALAALGIVEAILHH